MAQTQAHQETIPQIKTDFQPEEHLLAQRQSCLEELQNLQHEIRDLNGMFHNMRELTQEQAEQVQAIADNAEEALENVQMGESNLRKALAYKKAMYPVMGALLGTCVGGPIGLVAGLKAGGLAAVGCGILGFTGGSVLKSNPAIMQGNIEEEQINGDNQEQIELNNKKDEWQLVPANAATTVWAASTRQLLNVRASAAARLDPVAQATTGVLCSVKSYCSIQ